MIIKESTLNPSHAFNLGGLDYDKGVYIPFYTNKCIDAQGEIIKDKLFVGIRSKTEFSRVLQEPLSISAWSNGTDNYSDLDSLITDITTLLFNTAGSSAASKTGYSHTGAFADKPLSNNYVWQSGAGVNYTQADVNAGTYKVLSLSRAVHDAVDNPYWTTPTPSGISGIGLFQGANLPSGVSTLFDYGFDYDTVYPSSSGTGFEGSTGRIKLNDLNYGDQLRVRFDFNIIPQIANTTVEPALWYSNRDDNDDITFTFPLTTQPIFYGGGTVGNTYLNRVEISAWITSNEDVNALTLPAIKSDNPVIIQPLGLLTTIIR
jgi:hypothetical protein